MGYWGAGLRVLADRAMHGVRSAGLPGLAAMAPVPQRFLFVPSCLRPGDPLAARDYYEGRFTFAGRTTDTGGRSPFLIEAPSPGWAADLHGFRWLRHLRAADTELAAQQARALVDDWIAGPARRRSGQDRLGIGVSASRLIAFMQYSRFLLSNADHAFYRRYMGAVARQIRQLKRESAGHPACLETLQAAIALAMASLVLPASDRRIARQTAQLEAELAAQVFADGGHVSRNPAALVEILTDLLPLAQCYLSASRSVPAEVARAVDRMFPRLRAMRLGDGRLAHFHGSGFSKSDLIAAVLRHDQTGGKATSEAPQSGYTRFEAGGTVLIADTGLIPHGIAGAQCHASALAFEFSSSRHPVVVNIGTDRLGRPQFAPIARSTAAHSTLELGGVSSARFRRFPVAPPGFDMRCVAGPVSIGMESWPEKPGPGLVASHDGYAKAFGLIHVRGLALAPDGSTLDGFDRLDPARKTPVQGTEAVVRFHLHPAADVRREGTTIIVKLEDGEIWGFRAVGAEPQIEGGLFLAGVAGHVPCHVITLTFAFPETDQVRWRFTRLQV